MASRQPPRTPARRTRSIVAAGLVVGSAAVAAFGVQTLAPPSESGASPARSLGAAAPSTSSPDPAPAPSPSRPATTTPLTRSRDDVAPHGPHDVVDERDGIVPDGTTVFDGDVPAVANLDPVLLGALRQAASVAGRAGITFHVTSGWRSPAYQEQLLRDAIAQYGSEEEAARWVALPTRSEHVSGRAVDLGGSGATAWLERHGATYGLCPVYRNEPWHFELRPDAPAHGCPATYADPTHDPRMQP